MEPQNQPMTPAELGMLIGGITLLIVSLALRVYCVMKRRPYKLLIGLFPAAILMIGFSQIVNVKLPGVEIDMHKVSEYAANPTNFTAISNVSQGFNALLFTNKNAVLPPNARTNLTMALEKLERHPDLSPELRMAMVKLQLILGHTNEAATNLQYALRLNFKLVINPELKTLTKIK